MKTAIINGTVITPARTIENGGLIIKDGKITDVFEGKFTGSADRIFNAEENYISPGFIDIHTHGGGGYDFMDGTPEAFIGAAKAHLMHGTTSIVPTTLSCSDEELFAAFKCFEAAKKTISGGPNLLGLHLEGPYFSTAQAGAQDPEHLKSPRKEHFQRILDASGDILRVSAAVELDGALELGDQLRERGILASIGHSDAFYPDVLKAFEHGYTHITHLYSGMSSLRRIGPYRHLGVVESAYLIDGFTVEIIADGKHLPPELLKLILRFKPQDKICLVTDSMRGAGLPDGEIVKLGSLDKGQDVILEDGVAMLMDRTAFAGSVCTADRCIRTMHKLVQIPIADAVSMMTVNPARIIGAKTKGMLVPGMDADICIFDNEITIKSVFVSGEMVDF
jgi:N-acetylglucosamine-6-phosphate deacetylase